MIYYYNQKTHKYHIQGMCQYNSKNTNIKFDTEEELKDSVGSEAIICKICQRKRDKLR